MQMDINRLPIPQAIINNNSSLYYNIYSAIIIMVLLCL